jgi:hypothetical protein
LGFSIAAALAELSVDGAADCDADDEQPATARIAVIARPATKAARRVMMFPRSMPVRLSQHRP